MWRNLTADPREQDGAERAGGERRARSLLGSRLDLSWRDDSDQRGGTVDPARESKVPATSSAGEGRGGEAAFPPPFITEANFTHVAQAHQNSNLKFSLFLRPFPPATLKRSSVLFILLFFFLMSMNFF